MWLAWIVLTLHVAAFTVPLIGVRGVYKRAKGQFDEARRLRAEAVSVLEWREAEQSRLRELNHSSQEQEAGKARLAAEYAERVSAAGLSNKTYGELNILILTNGRSNLVALASAVQIARVDAFWVILGLVFGLVANLVPTIWPVSALVS
jgi:hypothetical protein